MVSPGTRVDLTKLPKSKFSAMKREAKRLGMSTDEYALRLIEENLDLEEEARNTPWEVLVEPVRKAFEGMSDAELDALVDRARRAPRRKRSSRR